MNLIRKNYLSILIIGISSTLLVVLVVYPLFKGIGEFSYNLFLEKNKIIYLNKEKEEVEKTENFYDSYQTDLEKIDNLFIDSEVPVQFINFLENTATESQIKLEISSMVKGKDKEGPWPSLSLQLLTTGSFSNFSKFLDKLENAPYLIEILELNTRKIAEKEKQAQGKEGIPNADTSSILLIKVFTK